MKINNKISLLLSICLFVFVNNHTTAQADSTRTGSTRPLSGDVISNYINTVDGQFSLTIRYNIIDTVTFFNSPEIILPDNWSFNITSINGNTYYPGDSIEYMISILYPTTEIPFYRNELKIDQHFFQIIDSSANDTVFQDYGVSAMVYFTPYNTLEIWSLEDYQNLNRRWFRDGDCDNTQRMF